jgi:hypothetical protein
VAGPNSTSTLDVQVQGPLPPRRRRSRVLSTRQVVWPLVVFTALSVGVFGYAVHKQDRANARSAALALGAGAQRDLVYGEPLSFGDEESACTDLAYDTSRKTWVCLVIDANTAHLPVARLAPYEGQCAELRADQKAGIWLCARGKPLPADQLEGAPPLRSSGDVNS